MKNKITKEGLIDLLKYTMIPIVAILLILLVDWYHG